MSRLCWIAVLSLVLTPLASPAQEYAIRLGKPGPGDQLQVKVDNATEVEFKALDSSGNAVVEKKEIKGHQFIFRQTGIERGPSGGDLVKLKRTYKKAQRTLDGDRRTLPFQGETVLIEKNKDGPFTFQIVDGEVVEGEDAKELHEEFNKGGIGKLFEMFQPKQAVKVGETWKLDVAMLAKEFSKDGKIDIDAAKATGAGKLTKAYQKGGVQFGVVELTLTLPITHFDHEGNKTAVKEGKLVIKLETDGAIDGSMQPSQLRASFDGGFRGDITANGMDLTLQVEIHAKAEEQRTPVK